MSNFLSVQVPPELDVIVSSIENVPVTDLILSKPLSLSKLAIVPVAPEVPPVTVLLINKCS